MFHVKQKRGRDAKEKAMKDDRLLWFSLIVRKELKARFLFWAMYFLSKFKRTLHESSFDFALAAALAMVED